MSSVLARPGRRLLSLAVLAVAVARSALVLASFAKPPPLGFSGPVQLDKAPFTAATDLAGSTSSRCRITEPSTSVPAAAAPDGTDPVKINESGPGPQLGAYHATRLRGTGPTRSVSYRRARTDQPSRAAGCPCFAPARSAPRPGPAHRNRVIYRRANALDIPESFERVMPKLCPRRLNMRPRAWISPSQVGGLQQSKYPWLSLSVVGPCQDA